MKTPFYLNASAAVLTFIVVATACQDNSATISSPTEATANLSSSDSTADSVTTCKGKRDSTAHHHGHPHVGDSLHHHPKDSIKHFPKDSLHNNSTPPKRKHRHH